MDKIINRHKDFWNRANTGAAIIGKEYFSYYQPVPFPLKGGKFAYDPTLITPDMLDSDSMLDSYSVAEPMAELDGIRSIGVRCKQAWMEGIIGCDIYASALSCSAKPKSYSLEEKLDHFSKDDCLRSDWFSFYKYTMDRAVTARNPAFAVRQFHLRGIIDMLAAYLGEEDLCIAVYDYPDTLDTLAARFVELYNDAVDYGLNARPLWNGGRVSGWHVYAPGDLLDYQIDASILFSPQMYKDVFLKYDQMILSRYPYQIVHTHYGARRQICNLLDIPELKCIQIQLERETGEYTFEGIKPIISQIQQADKCVVISGELSRDEVADYQRVFQSEGLAIFHWSAV